MKFKFAAIQLISTPNVDENLKISAELIAQAKSQGAQMVLLPENFAFMGMYEDDRLQIMETPGDGPIQQFLATQAKQHQIYLVGGTIPFAAEQANKVRSVCLVYNPQGEQVARYDKIHLFDVTVDVSETYLESAATEAGDDLIVAKTTLAILGLSVCYDLRFPELYRQLVSQGADILLVPAAFTQKTGQAHWEILLRARAIENLCFVVAANQGGHHPNGRDTFGHSMIIDPWGRVLASCEYDQHVVIAEIDTQMMQQRRKTFPALSHRRLN